MLTLLCRNVSHAYAADVDDVRASSHEGKRMSASRMHAAATLFSLWRSRAVRLARCILDRVSRMFGVAVLPQWRLAALRAQRRELFRLASNHQVKERMVGKIECIVFSKDRPMQLHALLSSFQEMVTPGAVVHVLYSVSDARYAVAYAEVERLFANRTVHFVKEKSFREDLLKLLREARGAKVTFLVDDILFTEPVDLAELAGLDGRRFIASLRLGKNLECCYTAQRKQPHPLFTEVATATQKMLCWRWSEAQLDWAYPMSLDGHVFLLEEIQLLAEVSNFFSPNTFEDVLADCADYFSDRLGLCYQKSRIVNVPCNRVQTDNDNVYGSTHQDDLLQAWEKGQQIDYQKVYGFRNVSAHQDISLLLTSRISSSAKEANA